MITSRLNEYGHMIYGSRTANSLAYMMSGFRGWELFGLVITNEDGVGCEVDPQSAASNAVNMCAVYGKNYSRVIESDDPDRESEQLDMGLTAIILFHGIDDISYMRRMTGAEYGRMIVREFIHEPTDLFFNS